MQLQDFPAISCLVGIVAIAGVLLIEAGILADVLEVENRFRCEGGAVVGSRYPLEGAIGFGPSAKAAAAGCADIGDRHWVVDDLTWELESRDGSLRSCSADFRDDSRVRRDITCWRRQG